MSSSTVLSFIIRILLCEIVASQNRLFMDPPVIDVTDPFVILEVKSDFSLTCSSDYPIIWKPFQGFTGAHNIEDQRNDSHYKSTIRLTNVSYRHVGYFYCDANITQSYDLYSPGFEIERLGVRINGLTQVYVFVKDVENPLVPFTFKLNAGYRKAVLQYENVVTDFKQNKYLIIPCKPSSPSFKVELLEDGKKLPDVDVGTMQKNQQKYIGFTIRFSSVEEIYGRMFTCVPNSSTHSGTLFIVRYNEVKIKSFNGFYGHRGEQLNLKCSIVIGKDEPFIIKWKFTNTNLKVTKQLNQSVLRILDHPTRSHLQVAVSEITISGLDIERDEGTYECKATDALQNEWIDRVFIEILEEGDDTIDLNALDGIDAVDSELLGTAVLKVKYKGRPMPTFAWYDEFGKITCSNNNKQSKYEEQITDGKYEEQITDGYVALQIKDVQSTDSGFYTLKAANDFDSFEKRFELRVKGPPRVTLNTYNNLVRQDEIVTFECHCTGYPSSTITWTFAPCDWRERTNCAVEHRKIEEIHYKTSPWSDQRQNSILMLNATHTGIVKCMAINTHGHAFIDANLQITDIPTGALFDIWGPAKDKEIVAGDNVTVFCGVSVDIKSYVTWYFNNEIVTSTDSILLGRRQSKYSRQVQITWKGIQTKHAGIYECRMTNVEDALISAIKKLKVVVYEPQQPTVDDTMPQQNTIEVEMGAVAVQLTCNIVGHPVPIKKWYKNGKLLDNSTKIRLSMDVKSLFILNITKNDGGKYECNAENRFGNVSNVIELKITNNFILFAWIVGAVALILIIMSCCIYSLIKFRQLSNEIKFINLNGRPEVINPELPLHEQIDLLSYDEKYEFPKEKLQLGKVLGCGVFGVVLKATATGILPTEEETVVAVKKLKETANVEEIVVLVNELKIMVHMGHHLNVVNLLGAVTSNIMNHELMVIVEFCRYGNLQNYLAKNRDSFVDQINSRNDLIDPTMLTVNGRDRTDRHAAIATIDLVCWLFQTARGMEYLSSRKIVHGDLAARNVLLCDNNVIKICDFGLATSMYKCCNYVKQSNQIPLPFKWLAIESIRDQHFSTCSDVWSFGIVMWELFSLGQIPYPGLDANTNLFDRLVNGYRMDKPQYATQEIYDVMLKCWNADPVSRPTFTVLEERFGKLLRNGEAEHYVELNGQYVVMKHGDFKGLTTPDCKPDDVYVPMKPIRNNESGSSQNSRSTPLKLFRGQRNS